MRNKVDLFTDWLNHPKTILLLMIVAFVIRAGFGVFLGERYLPMADQVVFDELARNIADGKGLMITDRLAGAEKRPRGLIFYLLLLLYFSGRFGIELVKEFQALEPSSVSLTMGQWLSLPFIVVGVLGLGRLWLSGKAAGRRA